MTNFEKIKSMSIEEMARFLFDITDNYDKDGSYIKTIDGVKFLNCFTWDIKEWLESEVNKNV